MQKSNLDFPELLRRALKRWESQPSSRTRDAAIDSIHEWLAMVSRQPVDKSWPIEEAIEV